MGILGGILQPGSQPLGNSSILSGNVGSGQITSFHVASGQLTGLELAPASIVSGRVASGSLDRLHHNSGCVVHYMTTNESYSGITAVALGSGGSSVVTAYRSSGLRLPAIGVVAGSFTAPTVVPVVTDGFVTTALSGLIASGFGGTYLYVGSGGLIINQSGFCGGASSGQGAAPTAAASGYSGSLVQRIGIAVSGGIYVKANESITSGLQSGLLGQF